MSNRQVRKNRKEINRLNNGITKEDKNWFVVYDELEKLLKEEEKESHPWSCDCNKCNLIPQRY